MTEGVDRSSRSDGEGVCTVSTINVEAGRAGCREAVVANSRDKALDAGRCCKSTKNDAVVAVCKAQGLDAAEIGKIRIGDDLTACGQGDSVVAKAAGNLEAGQVGLSEVVGSDSTDDALDAGCTCGAEIHRVATVSKLKHLDMLHFGEVIDSAGRRECQGVNPIGAAIDVGDARDVGCRESVGSVSTDDSLDAGYFCCARIQRIVTVGQL